jgi:CheY-like chemotaxis protein
VARVLLLEDEPVLRGSMARGLAKLPAVEVLEAGNLAEALALIDATPPQAIVSDIDLPGGRTGLELIGELRRRSLTIPVLYVSAYLKAYRSQIPPNAHVDIFEKPVPLEQLRAWIVEHVKAPPAGGRAPFCAADYLQLACMGRHSLEILVSNGPAGPARIVVVDGEVWSASDQAGDGVPAFKRAAFSRDGPVECRVLEGDAGPRSIEGGWEALLIDTARELDEQVRDAEAGRGPPPAPRPAPRPAPTPARAPASPPAPAAVAPAAVAPAAAPAAAHAAPAPPSDDERFATAWDRGIASLLRKDYPGALRAFVEARQLRPNDPRVAANLKRLQDLGFEEVPNTEG